MDGPRRPPRGGTPLLCGPAAGHPGDRTGAAPAPLARELQNGAIDGVCVPALRFPGWMRCPRCGLLHWRPWSKAEAPFGVEPAKETRPRCHCEGQPRLHQVAWVVAHPEGGLREVPWHFLAHQAARPGHGCKEKKDGETYLRLRRDRTDGLHWQLSCDRCGANPRLDPRQPLTLFGPEVRRQPWEWSEAKFDKKDERLGDESKPQARILEVNDARLYYPRVRGALVIPPESRIRRDGALALLYSNGGHRDQLDRTRSTLGRRALIRRLADEYRCPVAEVEAAWLEIQAGWPLYGQTVTPGGLLAKEFQALTEEIPDLADGEDFVPRHQTLAWRALGATLGPAQPAVLGAVSRLVAVTRLREVRVFTGFSRIARNFDDGLRPTTAKDNPGGEAKGRLVPPDLEGSLDWLPAIELFGEGIFFTLDEAMLQGWATQPGIQARTAALQARFERTGMRFPDTPILPLAPRFILLHTLAHLLIRQLETQAGYPAASIRERIYCGEDDPAMAGILVYVAVPDIVGSLGGLAELAEPRRFLGLLASVFDHADWCSLDPVCSEHEGQGPSQLNRAACHACALIPEPSCQFGNVLLDRTFVRGDLQGDVRPLLAFVAGG
ncbi:MAG: DUF1998 domain-containing protein [Opitutae bacterium]|nr:DUF1998 domain-containing protein [Opitutae bacterium]